MDRIVGQLLSELDNLGQAEIFIIAATNRPDLIEPNLLRPGRIEKCVYLGISQDNQSQLSILKALTRKFNLHRTVNLLDIVEKCPFTYTGADFYAIASEAMLNAVKRCVNKNSTNLDTITVSLNDFKKALRSITPSLSLKEIQKYEELKNNFKVNKNLYIYSFF